MCEKKICGKKCILCDKVCTVKNHDHEDSAEEYVFKNNKQKVHLCG